MTLFEKDECADCPDREACEEMHKLVKAKAAKIILQITIMHPNALISMTRVRPDGPQDLVDELLFVASQFIVEYAKHVEIVEGRDAEIADQDVIAFLLGYIKKQVSAKQN